MSYKTQQNNFGLFKTISTFPFLFFCLNEYNSQNLQPTYHLQNTAESHLPKFVLSGYSAKLNAGGSTFLELKILKISVMRARRMNQKYDPLLQICISRVSEGSKCCLCNKRRYHYSIFCQLNLDSYIHTDKEQIIGIH